MPRKTGQASGTGKTAGKTSGKKPTPSPEFLEDAIRHRAYQLHQERGATHGNDMDDWLRAEREITEQHQPPKARRNSKKKSQ